MFRRDLLKSALLGAAAIATGRAVRPTAALAAESATPLDTLVEHLEEQQPGELREAVEVTIKSGVLAHGVAWNRLPESIEPELVRVGEADRRQI